MKVEVTVLGSPSLIIPKVSVDVKRHWTGKKHPPPHPHPPPVNNNKTPEHRSCVKVEVDVLGPPPIIVPTVSVDAKQHWIWTHPGRLRQLHGVTECSWRPQRPPWSPGSRWEVQWMAAIKCTPSCTAFVDGVFYDSHPVPVHRNKPLTQPLDRAAVTVGPVFIASLKLLEGPGKLASLA